MKKNKTKLKRGQIYWEIIKLLGMTYLSGGGSISRPILPLLIKEIKRLLKESRNVDTEEEKIKTTLEKLEKRQIINLTERNDNIFVEIKGGDKSMILKYSIKSILDLKKKDEKWSGKWYLVFFDVPEIQRNKRDYLRYFLKKIGFFQYQKSVYVFPFNCKKEIDLIRQIVEGGKYMKYIIADKIEDEERIKIFFKI